MKVLRAIAKFLFEPRPTYGKTPAPLCALIDGRLVVLLPEQAEALFAKQRAAINDRLGIAQ